MYQEQPAMPPLENNSKSGRYVARASVLAVLVIVFVLGWAVGSGKIGRSNSTLTGGDSSENLNYTSVEAIYDTLRKDYDGTLDQSKLLDGLKQGLTQATGDPYTEYLTASEAEDLQNQLDGTFTGIGAELGKKDNNIVIIAPIAGFPAEKSGLRSSDKVTAIDGKTTVGMSIGDAVNKIRGPIDTKVVLTIVRQDHQFDVTITRARITTPSVTSKILDGNIGYMQINRFGDDTASLAQKVAEDFKTKDVKGVVLDLRSNPGGLLDAAVSVSSIWLPSDKTIVVEKHNDTVIKAYKSDGTNLLGDVPTVVLIDGGSASAAEITAGALRDNNAATLLGTKSYGKGSVQEIFCLSGKRLPNEHCPAGPQLKVTVAHWFTPSGKSINKQGLKPDKVVERTDSDIKTNRDPQLKAAQKLLTK